MDKHKKKNFEKKDKKKHNVVHTRPKKHKGTNVKIVNRGTIVETSTKLIPPAFTNEIKPHCYAVKEEDDDAVLCEFSKFAKAQYLAMKDIRNDGRECTYVFPQLLVMSSHVPRHLLEFSKERLKIPL